MYAKYTNLWTVFHFLKPSFVTAQSVDVRYNGMKKHNAIIKGFAVVGNNHKSKWDQVKYFIVKTLIENNLILI